MFRFVVTTILVLLFVTPSQARLGGCFNERCAPRHPTVAVDETCTCQIKYRDACIGCPCVIESHSCRPANGPQITERTCIRLGASALGVQGSLKCEETVVGKRCLCSGNVDVQCKVRPSNEPFPLSRRIGIIGMQGGYVQSYNKNRMIKDVAHFSDGQICAAEIYPNGEVKNTNCTKLQAPAIRNPVEAFQPGSIGRI